MEQIIEYLIGSIFLSSCFVYCGVMLFKQKLPSSLKTIIVILSLIIIIAFNYICIDNMVRTAVSYITILIVYRLLLNKPILQCSIASFVAYILVALGEVSFIATLSIINLSGVSINVIDLSGSIFTNIIISLFATLYLLLVYKHVNRILIRIKENNKIMMIITFILFVMANCTLFYKLYFHRYQLDKYLLFNLVLLVALSYIAFILIKQQYDKSRLSDEYEKYVEYSKQSEKLVEQLCITQHENRNELIIIKSMVNKNNSELIEYLDEIISSKDNIDNAWIKGLHHLPFGGLKGIIHNKVSEMKDKNINVFLDISKSVGESELINLSVKENNQLSKIIGVFLDNAKEAAMLSDDKVVSVCVYTEDKEIVFEISNTYSGEINLSKICDAGITSKGKGRGYGLALVDSIIEENKKFKNEIRKIDKYFVQFLRIKI